MLTQPLAVEFLGETSKGLPLVKPLRILRFRVKNKHGEFVDIEIQPLCDPTNPEDPGFATDFASIPRLLRGFVNPWHVRALLAAILHDYLLSHPREDFDRLAIDNAFRREMRLAGMNSIAREIRYLGVRIGSGRAYREARANQVPA